MKLSIVTTMYHSASFLPEFYRRVRDVAETISPDFEIIFVNDGSPDDSLEVALRLRESDGRVKVVDLSRNFGHHKAMMTGLMHAQGELVVQIDCDLEEDPEFLREFHVELKRGAADMVYGVQKSRKGRLFERLSGRLYWSSFRLLSNEAIPADQTMMRLMTRRYVDRLIEHQDRSVFLPGLWMLTGFRQIAVPVTKHSREGSTYTLRRKVAQAVDSITSFSSAPLVGIFYLGSLIILTSSTAAFALIVCVLFVQDFQAGWPSLIVSIWFLGGLTIFCIGILGIYLSKVFLEVKNRPLTVVRQVYQRQDRKPIQANEGEPSQWRNELGRKVSDSRTAAAHDDSASELTSKPSA